MKNRKTLSLKELFFGLRGQSISMRRRFVLCLIAALVFIVALLLLLLSVFDVTDSADDELEHIFNQQLDYSAGRISKDMGQLSACAVEFSRQMKTQIAEFETPFSSLRNNVSALTELQSKTYMTVLNNMRIADCSGAFYILDTTVNDTLDDTYYSGVYLRYTNVGSDITVRNSVCLFRGASAVARKNGINLSSTWECEMQKGTFPQMEAVLRQTGDISKAYLLTKAYKLPKAWEKVRFICAPISDENGDIIGVCGFEISDPFFHAAYQASDAESAFTVCGLMEEENGVYDGQIAPNASGFTTSMSDGLEARDMGRFTVFSSKDTVLIGKTKVIRVGQSEHTVAVMLPEKQHELLVNGEMSKIFLLLAVTSLLAVGTSVILSHRYIKPLIHAAEQIKSRQFDGDTKVKEFTDLFAHLAEQDRINEAELGRMRSENEDMLTAVNEMQEKMDETSRQNERLAYSRKDEIDPYDYEHFKNGISMLTEKEKQVLDLYMQGKTVKEIKETLGLQESTVRFHNRNIYAKLGVHSLKQLLRYAAIMKQDNTQ